MLKLMICFRFLLGFKFRNPYPIALFTERPILLTTFSYTVYSVMSLSEKRIINNKLFALSNPLPQHRPAYIQVPSCTS